MATRILSARTKASFRAPMFAPAGGRYTAHENFPLRLENSPGRGRSTATASSTGPSCRWPLQTAKIMGNRQSSTSVSPPESLKVLFNEAEAKFPSRFREHGWYLTTVRLTLKNGYQMMLHNNVPLLTSFDSLQLASLIGSGQQKLAGQLPIQAPRFATAISNFEIAPGLNPAS